MHRARHIFVKQYSCHGCCIFDQYKASALTKPLLKTDLTVYVAITFSQTRSGRFTASEYSTHKCLFTCLLYRPFLFCRLLFITSLASTWLLCFTDFISITFGNGRFYYCLSWMIDLGVNDPHFLWNEYCWIVAGLFSDKAHGSGLRLTASSCVPHTCTTMAIGHYTWSCQASMNVSQWNVRQRLHTFDGNKAIYGYLQWNRNAGKTSEDQTKILCTEAG